MNKKIVYTEPQKDLRGVKAPVIDGLAIFAGSFEFVLFILTCYAISYIIMNGISCVLFRSVPAFSFLLCYGFYM
jgi:hypothetical protein